jgi:hypothetical protein
VLHLAAETGDLVSAETSGSSRVHTFVLWSGCSSENINLRQRYVTSYEDETHESYSAHFGSSLSIEIRSDCTLTATDLSLPSNEETRMRAQLILSLMIGLDLALEISGGISAELWLQTTSSRVWSTSWCLRVYILTQPEYLDT